MNRNKTEAMWLGSKKYCTDEYYDIKWQLRVKILGIYLSKYRHQKLMITGYHVYKKKNTAYHSHLVKKKM